MWSAIYRIVSLLIELAPWNLYQTVHLWFNHVVPEEQHTHCDKEDSSVCETVRTEEKEQKNEDSVTVDIQASGIPFWICFF